MDGQTAQSTTFPSDADRLRLHRLICLRGTPERGKASPELSDEDQWCWHAYIYGFRRAVLGHFDTKSPVDEQGDWFNVDMAARAERYYRQKLGLRAKPGVNPTARHDEVRSNWKRISAPELTDAEHKLADPQIARMRQEAIENIARIVSSKRIARERGDQSGDWHKAPPPPPLAAPDDPAVLEWMRRMADESDDWTRA